MANTYCTKCRRFAKKDEYDQKDRTHARGYGCRKDEPMLIVNEAPEPPKVPIATRIGTVTNTGPINSMFAALLKSGLVKVESRP